MKTKKKKVKEPKRPRQLFWILGFVAFGVFYHSYGILTGAWASTSLVSIDVATVLAILELFALPFILTLFFWNLVKWWHERPFIPKHIFDDQGILD